jgi:hypothetical protein
MAFASTACTFTVASSLDLSFMFVSVSLYFTLKEVCFLRCYHCCFAVVTFKASVGIVTFDSCCLGRFGNFNQQVVACFVVNQIPIVD